MSFSSYTRWAAGIKARMSEYDGRREGREGRTEVEKMRIVDEFDPVVASLNKEV